MSFRSTQRPHRSSLVGLAAVAGVLALTVAACGGTSTSNPPPQGTSAAQAGNQGGQRTPPGTFGTAAAVSASSIEVQNPSAGQVTVNFGPSTQFTNVVSAAIGDVTVGECVIATGSPGSTGQLTANSVRIGQPTANGCTGGMVARGGRPSGAPGAPGTPRTRPSGGNRPAGGGAAVGSVTAVSGSTFTIAGKDRTGATTNTVVTVTGSTTFTKSVSANSSAVTVGDCIAAMGSTDDTGAVTATSITISKPGPNGCMAALGTPPSRRRY